MKLIPHPIETPCPNCSGMAYYCPSRFVQYPDELVIESVISCLNCNQNTVHEFGMTTGLQKLLMTVPMSDYEVSLWADYEAGAE